MIKESDIVFSKSNIGKPSKMKSEVSEDFAFCFMFATDQSHVVISKL